MDEQPLPLSALAGGGFTLLAVTLEVLGSVLGDGVRTTYPGWLVPIAWPTTVRVVWWLVAAAGAVVANRGLARVTGRPRPVRTVVAAVPFVGFAAAIALDLPVATWH